MFVRARRLGAVSMVMGLLLAATVAAPAGAESRERGHRQPDTRTRTQRAHGRFVTAIYGIGNIDSIGTPDVEQDAGSVSVKVKASGAASGILASDILLGMNGGPPTLTGTIVGDALCGGIFDRHSGWTLFVIRNYGPYVPIHYLLFAYDDDQTWGGLIWYGDQTYDCSNPATYAFFAEVAPSALAQRRTLVSGEIEVE